MAQGQGSGGEKALGSLQVAAIWPPRGCVFPFRAFKQKLEILQVMLEPKGLRAEGCGREICREGPGAAWSSLLGGRACPSCSEEHRGPAALPGATFPACRCGS